MTPLTIFLLYTSLLIASSALFGASLCYLYLSRHYAIHRHDDLSAVPESDGDEWSDEWYYMPTAEELESDWIEPADTFTAWEEEE